MGGGRERISVENMEVGSGISPTTLGDLISVSMLDFALTIRECFERLSLPWKEKWLGLAPGHPLQLVILDQGQQSPSPIRKTVLLTDVIQSV